MTSSFAVRRSPGEFVAASPAAGEDLPPSVRLPLSWVDRIPSMKRMQDSIHVFARGGSGGAAASAIRSAISRALVPYYPLAGVFVLNGDGELEVDCNNRGGVWFVVAAADCSLDDVRRLDLPFAIPFDEFLPQPPPGIDISDLMIMMQVTEFKCGGFAMGLRTNHAICDGMGTSQFIMGVSDVAMGKARPSIEPIWGRESLPAPRKIPGGAPVHLPPAITDYQITVVDIPAGYIDHVKRVFCEQTGERCSGFDVLAAKTWRSRARAIGGDPAATLRLVFPMTVIHLLKDAIYSGEVGGSSAALAGASEGYYGNCFHLAVAAAPRSEVAGGSMIELVKLIRKTKAGLSEGYFGWIKGEVEFSGEDDPSALAGNYAGAMFLVDWSRLGMLEADYGWGTPENLLPAFDIPQFNQCISMKPPERKKGLRLWAQTVAGEHVGAFLDEMASSGELGADAGEFEFEVVMGR